MKTLSTLLLLLFSLLATAQDTSQDIIYLKSGIVLRGKILERRSDGSIKMLTNDGRETIVGFREVKNITMDGIGTNPADYGSERAIGLLLRGEGGIGVSYRIKLKEKDAWADFNVQPDLRVLINQFNDKVKLSLGINVGTEFDFFLKRFYKESKQRVRANGVYLRGVHALNQYSVTMFSVGWCSEYFKLNNYKRSFMLNLGPAIQVNHWYNDPKNVAYTDNMFAVMPALMFKIQWNFFQ